MNELGRRVPTNDAPPVEVRIVQNIVIFRTLLRINQRIIGLAHRSVALPVGRVVGLVRVELQRQLLVHHLDVVHGGLASQLQHLVAGLLATIELFERCRMLNQHSTEEKAN